MKRTKLVMAVTLTMGFAAWAQGPAPAPEEGDAPDHGVARISVVNGEVSVRRGDTGDLTPAVVNGPLLAGDRILTGAGSRAEVQLDGAHMIRLAPFTEVRIGELQYRQYDIQVATGTAIYRVQRDSDAEAEVATPVVSMHPRMRGSYRITLRPDSTVEVAVRSGEADVFSPNGSEVVRAGQTMLARGTQADTEFQIVASAREDEFEQWSNQRDRDLDRSVSSRYVSPDVYGTEELDANGDWVQDDQYGNVWAPRVGPDWAPYRVGRWGWVDYYGWSWISGDPWGWAPYHYGRWFSGPRGWMWSPGAMNSRAYWRPALVGFFGWGGGGYNGGFGFGNVGWCPLAPGEAFRPWYGSRFGGRPGFNSYTMVNNTNITNVYRNARFDRGLNGVTSVRSGEFGRGQINNGNFVRAGERDLRGVGDIRGQVPLAPGSESRRFTDRNVNPQAFPRSNENARFFSRGQGQAQGPQAGVPTQGGQARGRGGVAEPRQVAPGQAAPRTELRQGGQRGGGSPSVANPGWRRLDGGGATSRALETQTPVDRGAGNQAGWRRLDGGSTPQQGNFGTRGGVRDNSSDTGNWRRLDGPRTERETGSFGGGMRQMSPQFNQEAPSTPAYPAGMRGNGQVSQPSQPNFGGMDSTAPRMQPRQFGGGERPVQINPPIVRERPPSDGGGNRSYSGFGQARPAYNGGGNAAPSRGDGGGGGAVMRGNRGGGGGGSPAPQRGGGGGGGNRGR